MKQNKYKTIIIALLCFMLPALITLIAFAKMGMAPFGDKSTMIMDMAGQYVEFLCGLKNGDFFFSWAKALGGNYVGVFTYYVSSPMSFLTLLCPNSKMPIAVLFLTVFKIGLAGLTFSFLLKYKFGRYDFSTVLFSMLYGLMAYNIAYSMCIMWLDGVIWLPVLIIGVEKILDGKNSLLLTLALFVSFISTYYISYMTGIFTALYFLYRCFEKKIGVKMFFSYIRKFVFSVIVAASWGAFLLLPTLMSLFQGKIGTRNMDYNGNFNFKIIDFLHKLVPSYHNKYYDTITNGGVPFIYCGIMALILFVIFFALKKISLRSKILTGSFVLLLFSSLWLCRLDKIWHVFQYPNWFPYRYSFIFSFLIILTAYRAFLELKLTKPVIAVVLILVCSFDMYSNTIAIFKGLDREFGYESYSYYNDYKEKIEPLVAETNKDENGFFRVGATFEKTKNESIGFGYNGITHYSSTYNRYVNDLLRKMGMAQAWMWSSYFGSTMVTDALFSVRYIISESPVSPSYNIVKGSGSATLYYNPNALSIGTAVNERSLFNFEFSGNAFEAQNRMIKALTNTSEDCFIPVEISESASNGEFKYNFVSNGMPVYAYFSSDKDNGELLVNGERLSGMFSSETRCIHYLGTFNKNENVSVVVRNSGTLRDKFCYYLDMGKYNEKVGALKAKGLQVDYYRNGSVSGTVNANAGDVLFTTIPYDQGWKAYVDGREVGVKVFADSLITVPLSAGTHKVKLTYIALGLPEGIIISVVPSMLVLILFFIKKKRKS